MLNNMLNDGNMNGKLENNVNVSYNDGCVIDEMNHNRLTMNITSEISIPSELGIARMWQNVS